jgi:hypothetical protein
LFISFSVLFSIGMCNVFESFLQFYSCDSKRREEAAFYHAWYAKSTKSTVFSRKSRVTNTMFGKLPG